LPQKLQNDYQYGVLVRFAGSAWKKEVIWSMEMANFLEALRSSFLTTLFTPLFVLNQVDRISLFFRSDLVNEVKESEPELIIITRKRYNYFLIQ